MVLGNLGLRGLTMVTNDHRQAGSGLKGVEPGPRNCENPFHDFQNCVVSTKTPCRQA